MKNIFIKLFSPLISLALGTTLISRTSPVKENANSASSDDYYSLLATAIDASNTNTFEDNKNPPIFDSSSEIFRNVISMRKDTDTYNDSIEASSSYEFSNKYSKKFASSVDSSIKISGVTTDVSAKFDTDVNSETWKRKVESFDYYYWFYQKYIVNIDWKDENINNALSSRFKRELNNVTTITSAKALLREFGTHVYSNCVLGGKMEITKYFAKEASYQLSEEEKSAAASLNVIVDTAKVDAQLSGSANLSKYESNSLSSSSYYSKLNFHAYGGDANGAMNASDLFQYKTQFGTGTASGFLYEAWTNSFNRDDVALKVVSTKNAIPIWDILNKDIYGNQIALLKKAWNNMCYESYALKCEKLGIPCNYIESLEYSSKNNEVRVKPYTSSINLPEDTIVRINLSDLITKEFDSNQYSIKLSSNEVATILDNMLIIKPKTKGNKFDIELFLNDVSIYKLHIDIKEEVLSGGYGTSQQPCLIHTKQDFLQAFQDLSFSEYHYQLSNDIDLLGEKIDVGGSGTSSTFNGSFDGNGYAIKNFTIKASDFNNGYPYVGLFGKNNGVIKNLKIEDAVCLNDGLAEINNSNIMLSAGILVGYNSGTITNCQVKNSAIRISSKINKNNSTVNVGGIAGYSEGTIEYSAFADGNIFTNVTNNNGNTNVGTLVGMISGSSVSQAYVSNTKINVVCGDRTKFAMGGIAGKMTTRASSDKNIINPLLSMCIVYGLNPNKTGETFGFISGLEEKGEFSNCYFKAREDLAVAGKAKNNCKREDEIKLGSLPTAFKDNWCDGEGGPVLLMHLK